MKNNQSNPKRTYLKTSTLCTLLLMLTAAMAPTAKSQTYLYAYYADGHYLAHCGYDVAIPPNQDVTAPTVFNPNTCLWESSFPTASSPLRAYGISANNYYLKVQNNSNTYYSLVIVSTSPTNYQNASTGPKSWHSSLYGGGNSPAHFIRYDNTRGWLQVEANTDIYNSSVAPTVKSAVVTAYTASPMLHISCPDIIYADGATPSLSATQSDKDFIHTVFNGTENHYWYDDDDHNVSPTVEYLEYSSPIWSLAPADEEYASINATTGAITVKKQIGNDVTLTLSCSATVAGNTVNATKSIILRGIAVLKDDQGIYMQLNGTAIGGTTDFHPDNSVWNSQANGDGKSYYISSGATEYYLCIANWVSSIPQEARVGTNPTEYNRRWKNTAPTALQSAANYYVFRNENLWSLTSSAEQAHKVVAYPAIMQTADITGVMAHIHWSGEYIASTGDYPITAIVSIDAERYHSYTFNDATIYWYRDAVQNTVPVDWGSITESDLTYTWSLAPADASYATVNSSTGVLTVNNLPVSGQVTITLTCTVSHGTNSMQVSKEITLSEEEHEISTLEDLQAICSTGIYVITDDITVSSGGYTTKSTFSGTLTARAKSDGIFPVISDLTVPLFATATDATISNIMLKDVNISRIGYVGAIACTANGETKIYNCGILPTTTTYDSDGKISSFGSSVASTNTHCGSLVGMLEGTARVINCFSYSNVSAPVNNSKVAAGLVGYNNTTSYQGSLNTVVVNCMFYGEIPQGHIKRPVYGGKMIRNDTVKGINPYDYYRAGVSFDNYDKIDKYNRSWPADEEYLTRFEYYRSILNSNRQLMAWWVSGNIADTALIAKWVLDPSIAPYPILKKWGKYPSIINPDPAKTIDPRREDADGNPLTPVWTDRSSAATYQGRSLGTLSVAVKPGSHASSAIQTAYGTDGKPLTLTITDMDTLNHDYGYYKVQLPYYNELFGNPNSTDHDTRFGGNYKAYVVTGWKITNITGGTQGTFVGNVNKTKAGYQYSSTAWESGYNFADRNCTSKDLYDVSGRVFAQGGYFYVPEGVTAITIEAYWGKAVYLHNTGHYLDRVNITAKSGDRTVGDPFAPTEMSTLSDNFQEQTVYDAWHTAVSNLDEADKSGSGENTKLSLTVYDQAIVLLSNYQIKNQDGAVGYNIDNKWHPYTIMSIDQDLDNEPDYCFELQFRGSFNRRGIQPIRFDFLPVPELGLAVRHNTNQHTIGIFIPLGHFEITETSFMHTTQFEYDAQATGSGTGYSGPKVPAPVILNGGHFEQIVARYGPQNNTQYFLMGGHFRMLRFTPGAHTNRQQNAKIRLCAVNVLGGEYHELYLSGIYRPDISPVSVTNQGNPHCYINGGRFGLIAGAGYDKILGDITFKIDHSKIDDFYGGGINGANPVGGSIDVTINHSIVGNYCGGPKVGTMTAGKTVTTHATGSTFAHYYGGGNGGTSYYREQGYDGNSYDVKNQTNSNATYWSTGNLGNDAKYNVFNPLNTLADVSTAWDESKGYHALYEFECFVSSNGLAGEKPTVRTYTHWAQFGTTSTGNVTNVLKDCVITGNFYGGGKMGNVDGDINSTLTNTTVKGTVFGGGFSGTIEPFRIHDKTTAKFPYLDKAGVMQNGLNSLNSLEYLKNDDGSDRWYTWSNAAGHDTDNPTFQEDGKWYVYTTVSLNGLGVVSGNVTLTIDGNSVVGTEGDSTTGNVYGGGDESPVGGNTTVKILGTTKVLGNVYGGGNDAAVSGNTDVQIGGSN